jgi:hypothetical protein
MPWIRINDDELELVGNPDPHFNIDEARNLLEEMRSAPFPVRNDTIYEPWIEALRNWPNVHINFRLIWPLSGWLETDESKSKTTAIVERFFRTLFYVCPVRMSEQNNAEPLENARHLYEDWIERVLNPPRNGA